MSRKHKHDPVAELRARLNGLINFHTDQAHRAATARAVHQIFNEVCNLPATCRGNPEANLLYRKALDRLHAAIDNAYPPGFWEDYQRLRNGDPAGLETAVAFLEADPWFFRSGYAKEGLIRYLTRFDLSPEHARRLRGVVLAAVDGRDRREFRSYCRLARKVCDPELRAELQQRLRHDDPRVRRHARWVLEACGGVQARKTVS